MKNLSGLTRRTPAALSGHTLMIVLLVVGLLTLSLVSYLSLTTREHASVMRSLSWNAALPLAEAGVEEALAALTKNTTNFTADGWTSGASGYSKQRYLANGRYNVSFQSAPNGLVTITSTGYAPWVGAKSGQNSFSWVTLPVGTSSNAISRTVQVTGRFQAPLEMPGLVANYIDLLGTLNVDSYNSTNPLYNVNGQYNPARATAEAVVGNPLPAGTFSLGGHSSVKGYVVSGPGAPLPIAGGSASVGDLAWVQSGTKGVETGHATNGFTIKLPDVQAPFTWAPAPGSGSVGGTNYDYVLSGGNYLATSLLGSGSSASILVTAPSVVYVTGSINSQVTVVFKPGAQLDLYIATPSVTLKPDVQGATPLQFRVWGLPSFTDMKMTGGSFVGIIYAPQLNLSTSGNGKFCGAFVINSLNCNGTFSFHYDTAVGGVLPTNVLQVLSWAEL